MARDRQILSVARGEELFELRNPRRRWLSPFFLFSRPVHFVMLHAAGRVQATIEDASYVWDVCQIGEELKWRGGRRAGASSRSQAANTVSPYSSAHTHAHCRWTVRPFSPHPTHMLQVGQFRVVRVVEPARDGDGVVGVEDVRGWAVVDDDGLPDRPPELGEVLYVVALVVVARLAEEAVLDDFVDVELVEHRVRVLEHERTRTAAGDRRRGRVKDAWAQVSYWSASCASPERSGKVKTASRAQKVWCRSGEELTFDRLAVNTTTS